MIFGTTEVGAASVLTPDNVRFQLVEVTQPCRVAKLTAYVDGQGTVSGDATVRPVLYAYDAADGSGALLAVGSEVVIEAGQEAGWVDFPFDEPYAAELLEGTYRMGLHSGGVSNAARGYFVAGTTGRTTVADTYADGPAASHTTASYPNALWSLFLTASTVWEPPPLLDEELARFGFQTAQRLLGGVPDPLTARHGTAEWHGTRADVEMGSFAIVNADGPLTDWVGERVRVTNRATRQSVHVYVHREDTMEEDISLTRRAFAAISELAKEDINVYLEVLA